MIDLLGIDLLGYENNSGPFNIDADGEFSLGSSPATLEWVERRIGAVPTPSAKYANLDTEIPMLCLGEDADEILDAMGELREVSEQIKAAAQLGGTEITWQMLGATEPSTLICFAAEIGPVDITKRDKHLRVGRFTLKLTCAPFILGDWETLATGRKLAGIPAADVTVTGYGDLPGPARITVKNEGSTNQQFFMAGLQWEDYRASNSLTLPASTFDVATSPLNGTYTAGTNEVQRATKTGTISGGTFTLTFEGQTTAALAYNATTATVKAALEGLSTIGTGNINTSGSALSAGNMDFTFQGDLAGRNVSEISISSSLTGGGSVAMSTTTPGTDGYVSTTVYSGYSAFLRTDDQTDVGSYQIWALVYSNAEAKEVRLRARWSVGDSSIDKANRSETVNAKELPVWVYLGDAHITPTTAGTHRWNITLEATTTGTTGKTLRIHEIAKKPIGRGRVTVKSLGDATQTLVLSDDFEQTSGSYTGKTMPQGGTVSGGGDADDFTVDSTLKYLKRTATSDTANTGRYVYASIGAGGAGITDCAAKLEKPATGLSSTYRPASGMKYGVLLRFVDSSNYAYAVATADGLSIYKKIGGSVTLLGTAPFPSDRTVYATVRSDGTWSVGTGTQIVTGTDSVFSTGGTLEKGNLGIYEEYTSASAATRYYDNFRAWALPVPSAAVYASRNIIWQPNSNVEREATGGTYYAPASGARKAGVPQLGPGTNRLLIATADQNPDNGASGGQAPALTYTVEQRPAWQLGAHE